MNGFTSRFRGRGIHRQWRATMPGHRVFASLLMLALLMGGGVALAQTGGQQRPQLSGAPTYLDTAHFRVHYTLGGADAVAATDADGSGAPDYAEFVARIMEEVYHIEVEEFGWPAPPPDGREGGSALYDVYLYDIQNAEADLSDAAGYMDYFGGLLGDNPNSPLAENWASYSYIGMNNAYNAESLAPRFTVETYIRAVVAHEFHHAIQAGYDSEEPHGWLWEATSTWMESEVYPQASDNMDYIDSLFKSPDTCLIGRGGDRPENGLHWYAQWVFLQSLDQTYGHDFIRQVWEQATTLDGYAALDAALAQFNDTPEAAVLRYAVRNLLRDYEREHVFPVLRPEGVIHEAGAWEPRDGVQGLGTDYIALALLERGPLTVTVEGEALDVRAVGIAGNRADEIDLNGGGVVDLGAYQEVYLLVTSLRREGDAFNCRTMPYTVTVRPGGEPSPVVATHNAANYVPLR